MSPFLFVLISYLFYNTIIVGDKNMNYKEMKEAVNLLSKEWNLGKKEAKAEDDICAWIYLLSVLEESEEIYKIKEGKKLIGFTGYYNKYSKKHKLRKKFYKLIKQRLYKSKSIKDLNALLEYEKTYDYLPRKLKDYFDGEVSILIVDEAYRGKNIGAKLLTKVFNAAKNVGMKNLKIVTDESCNYMFYEVMGCTKVYETVVENKETDSNVISSERAFIYEKKL